MSSKLSKEEEIDKQVSNLKYKYDVGEVVLCQGASGGFFWAKIHELSWDSWGLFSKVVRAEYWVECDHSGSIVRVPENWMENMEERQAKFDEIKRLKEKSNKIEEEGGDVDIIEALKFKANELNSRMWPDEITKLNQVIGGL